MRGICAGTLALEAVVIALATPVMIAVDDVDKPLAFAVGLGIAVLAVVTCGLLRHTWAYWLGHLVQVGAIAMGFLTPVMFFVGAMFTALWITAYVLGRRIEADKVVRAEAERAYAEHREPPAPEL